MVEAVATATEMQNNFGRYLNMVMNGNEVLITRNGTEVGRLVPRDAAVSYLTDSLTGVLKGKYEPNTERANALKKKYAITD